MRANSHKTKAGCSTPLQRCTYKSVQCLPDKTAASPPSQLLPQLFGACVPFSSSHLRPLTKSEMIHVMNQTRI